MADTTDTRVSQEIFKLDTSHFNEIIKKSQELSEKMADLKNQMDAMKAKLMYCWVGEGRNAFEKNYRLLSQQFGDLRDDLRDISEDLFKIEESYIQADVDSAKALDGRDSRY